MRVFRPPPTLSIFQVASVFIRGNRYLAEVRLRQGATSTFAGVQELRSLRPCLGSIWARAMCGPTEAEAATSPAAEVRLGDERREDAPEGHAALNLR